MPSILEVPNTSLKPHINRNGDVAKIGNNTDGENDLFQHLPKQQQNVLLLNGPGQKYTLHTGGQIPELKSEREILIKVCNSPGCAARVDAILIIARLRQ